MESCKANSLELVRQFQNDGAVCLSRGDNKGAEFLYLQAHHIIIKTVGALHRLVIENLLNLGLVNCALGYNRQARKHFSTALNIASSIGLDGDPLCITLNTRLADSYIIEGNLAAAELVYHAFLSILFDQPQMNFSAVAATRTELAHLYAEQGKVEKALEQIDCIRINHDVMIENLSTSVSCEQSAGIDHSRLAYYFALSLSFRYFKNSSEATLAMLMYTFRRKNLQMELELIRQQLLLNLADESKPTYLNELNKVRRRLTINAMPFSKISEYTDIQCQQLLNDESQRKQLEGSLARMLTESSVINQLNSIDLAEVSRSLSQEETYIEFVRYRHYQFTDFKNNKAGGWQEYRFLAFVIKAGSLKGIQLIDLGEAEKIDRLVKTFRTETCNKFSFPNRGLVCDQQAMSKPKQLAGIALRQQVFDPLACHFGESSSLILVLDSTLWTIPFGALPRDDIENNAVYLKDRFNIRYLNCGRELINHRNLAKKNPSQPLVIADVECNKKTRKRSKLWLIFDCLERFILHNTGKKKIAKTSAYNSDSFALLAGAGVEAKIVAELLGVPVHRGFKARKMLFRKATSPSILHFSTHACFVPHEDSSAKEEDSHYGTPSRYIPIDNPMLRSAVLLADKPSNSPAPISAEQILGLDLRSTELVVLSACDSGLGEIKTGEGVFGLRRAFMLVGVNAVIMSLWQVADLPTTLLMVQFYRNFTQKHQTIDDSLRDAQKYLQKITVSDLGASCHTAEIIEKICSKDPGIQKIVDWYNQQPQSFRPFEDPFYWGGFVLVGKNISVRNSK